MAQLVPRVSDPVNRTTSTTGLQPRVLGSIPATPLSSGAGCAMGAQHSAELLVDTEGLFIRHSYSRAFLSALAYLICRQVLRTTPVQTTMRSIGNHGTRGGGGEGGGEQGGGEHASVSTEVPVQDQTRTKRIRYKPASKDIK